MYKQIVLVIVAASFAVALDNFEKCKGNGIGEFPNWVTIRDCPSAPCIITEGDTLTAEAEVVTPSDTQNITVKLDAYKFGIKIDFEIPEETKKACDFIVGAKCPLKKGDKYIYKLNLFIDKIPIDNQLVDIEFALLADTGKNMNCIRFPARIFKKKP